MQSLPNYNKTIQFVKRPEGRPTPEVFAFEEKKLPALRANEFLVKNLYLSMDPALVGRMRDESNYAESVVPGDVMHAYAVGQVIASNHARVKVGEVRFGRFDMQEYSIQTNPEESRQINLGLAQATWYLGPVGITGATAYFGLLEIGQPKRGDTVVVSAGGSSVGSIVAQLAKIAGCRVVAIVSTEEKAKQVKLDYGYDAAVTYRDKSIAEIEEGLKQACPNGIDVYFDNVSGDISEALLDLYNDYARIVVCGRLGISHLNDTRKDVGRRDNNLILAKRIRKQGFVLLDYQPRMMEAVIQLATWVRQGKLTIKEDIMEGVESAPKAFFRMLNGENQGKQLVHLADVDDHKDPAPRWLGSALTSNQFPRKPILKAVSTVIKLKKETHS